MRTTHVCKASRACSANCTYVYLNDHDISRTSASEIVIFRLFAITIFRILNRSLRKNIATRGVGYATVDIAYHSAFLDTEIKETLPPQL
jgi:hypothetical protein